MPSFLRGVLVLVALVLNTLFWSLPLFAGALLKLLLPFAPLRRRIDRALNALANGWVACNSLWIRGLPTRWRVEGADQLVGLEPQVANEDHEAAPREALGQAVQVPGELRGLADVDRFEFLEEPIQMGR